MVCENCNSVKWMLMQNTLKEFDVDQNKFMLLVICLFTQHNVFKQTNFCN